MKETTKTPITLESIDRKIDERFGLLDSKIDHIVRITSNSFTHITNEIDRVDKKIDGVEMRLGNQIAGIDNRIDDIGANKVNYGEHKKLETRVVHMEKKMAIK